MEKLIEDLRRDYSHIDFEEADRASWSSEDQRVFYDPSDHAASIWAVLHELGHALLGHKSYGNDTNLLQKESDAWERALIISERYKVVIDPDHIQNCLDTYRDWLHKRSTCPTCGRHGLQRSKSLYYCPNCQNIWKVSSERFCRPYRLKKALGT
jgi:hypothetical protein